MRSTLGSETARRHLSDPDEDASTRDTDVSTQAPSGSGGQCTDRTSDRGTSRSPRLDAASSNEIRRLLSGARTAARRLPVDSGGAAGTALGVVLVAALVLLSVLLVGAVVAQNRAAASRAAQEAGRYTAPPVPTVVPIRARVALIGDETAAATGSGTRLVRRWSSIVGDDLGIAFTVLAADGSGYVTKGTGKRTFMSQASAVPSDVDAVVLFGGGHDAGRSRLTLARAATKTIAAVHVRAPRARVIVVGPLVRGTALIAEVDDLRGVLRSSASVGKAKWVDPIAAGWVPVGTETTSTDTTSAAAGERRIARRMAPLLEPLTTEQG